MKRGSVIVAASIILVISLTSCITTVVRPANGVVGSEDTAIAKLGDDILFIKMLLANKKIGVLNFTTLDWQILDAGKRISNRLTDYLARKQGLAVVPRAVLDAKMKTQAVEQASLYDVETMQKSRKSLPVDVFVIGTVMQDMGTVKIDLKVVDVATGRLMLLSSVRMPASGEFNSQDKPEMIELYKKSPDKITDINKSYYLLRWMKEKQPLVFLLVTLNTSEMKALAATNTVLTGKLDRRKGRYQKERPDVIKKIMALQHGLSLMERYDQQRFIEIMKLKRELLGKMK